MEHVRIAKWPELLKLAPPICPCNTQFCPHETAVSALRAVRTVNEEAVLLTAARCSYGVLYLDLVHSWPWFAPCHVRGLPPPPFYVPLQSVRTPIELVFGVL